MNRTPPHASIADPSADISPDSLAVIGTLARTYDAQRLRLIERQGDVKTADSPLRPLTALEPAVVQDGAPVSASIVDAVEQAADLAGTGVTLPLAETTTALVAAEAGWWDALLGDIERRTGLAPRSITVSLPAGTDEAVKAVFADRLVP